MYGQVLERASRRGIETRSIILQLGSRTLGSGEEPVEKLATRVSRLEVFLPSSREPEEMSSMADVGTLDLRLGVLGKNMRERERGRKR